MRAQLSKNAKNAQLAALACHPYPAGVEKSPPFLRELPDQAGGAEVSDRKWHNFRSSLRFWQLEELGGAWRSLEELGGSWRVLGLGHLRPCW